MSGNDNQEEAPKPDDSPELEFRRLSSECKVSAFCCGVSEIDKWFRKHALAEHAKLKSRVITAHLSGNANPCGFYALSINVEPDKYFIEKSQRAFFDRWFRSGHLATVHLSWIGVQRSMQRNGIGKIIMGHAFREFYEIVIRTGIAALTLNSIDVETKEFYKKLGFLEYGCDPSMPKMFLTANAVMDLIENNAC